jgi:transposase
VKPKYTETQTKIFVDMWHQGYTANEIADRLGGSLNSIRQFACRYRKKYGLDKRQGGYTPPRKDFDKQWHGVIPCGHWMIKKPWG